MRRLILTGFAVLAILWLLLQLQVLPAPVARIVAPIVGLACSFACPLFFLTILLAPGLYRDTTEGLQHSWARLRTRRIELEDLQRKIARLNKPHHMIQLGALYLRQGKTAKAASWFEKALEGEPDSLEAQYRLGLCYFEQGRYEQAAELLERVHAVKPEYDYGLAYLRLAESQQKLGNVDRASEIYEIMLRFYPGHPEGSYNFALLLADAGDMQRAKELMQEIVVSLRHSPRFQRTRNRHWMLKARWWLWRH